MNAVKLPPLHETLLSQWAFEHTKLYRDSPNPDTIETLRTGARVLFYDDTTWFKTHKNELKQYACWCDKYHSSNYTVNPDKCADYIMSRCKDIQSNSNSHKIKSQNTTLFNKARFIIPTLERLAKWQGEIECSSNLAQKGKVFLVYKDLLRASNTEKNSEQIDYAASSRRVTKRFTVEEKERLLTNLWNPILKYNPTQIMRRLIQQILPAADGRRGEDLREIKIAMLQTHYINAVQPAPCHVIGASLRVVKERIINNETLIGWARSKNRDCCPVGALACYMVWLLDVQGLPLLDIMKQDLTSLQNNGPPNYKPKWRQVYLLHGDSYSKPLSYSRHNEDVHDIYKASGISKAATTHVHRTDLICRQTESGVPHIESRIHQGFEHTTSTDIYLRGGFNVSAMLPAVGWEDRKSYFCWWESDGKNIPQQLLQAVFPQLDAISRLADPLSDISAKEVCKLLRHLRKVFLEDAVFRHPLYPEFPAYQHPIFINGTLKNKFLEYSIIERQQVTSREQTYKQRDADILSKINNQEKSIQMLSQHLQQILQKQTPSQPPNPARCLEEPYLPLPSMPQVVQDVQSLYDMWCQSWKQLFQAHTEYYSKCQWTKCFNKQDANINSKRWHMYKDFLHFMDQLDSHERELAFIILKSYATTHKLDHNKLIKKVFYHCVRPNTVPDKEVQHLPEILYQEFVRNGINLVQIDVKQDHSKKQQRS